ncbi:hypothetical protein C8Q74DRAFT_1222687 [Fomes fomentarius]|nr:hypothetical protein C8Q74DRAFT_1222687 [Fomes fomentarius]
MARAVDLRACPVVGDNEWGLFADSEFSVEQVSSRCRATDNHNSARADQSKGGQIAERPGIDSSKACRPLVDDDWTMRAREKRHHMHRPEGCVVIGMGVVLPYPKSYSHGKDRARGEMHDKVRKNRGDLMPDAKGFLSLPVKGAAYNSEIQPFPKGQFSGEAGWDSTEHTVASETGGRVGPARDSEATSSMWDRQILHLKGVI